MTDTLTSGPYRLPGMPEIPDLTDQPSPTNAGELREGDALPPAAPSHPMPGEVEIVWFKPEPIETPWWPLTASFVALLLAAGAVAFAIYVMRTSPSSVSIAVPAKAAEPIPLPPPEIYWPPAPKPGIEDQFRQWCEVTPGCPSTKPPPSVNQKPISQPRGGEWGEQRRHRRGNAAEEEETRQLNQGQLR